MHKLLTVFLAGLMICTSCTYDQVAVPEVCTNDLVLSLSEQLPSACGIASGEIIVSLGGQAGEEIVTYQLNGGTAQESPIFSALPAGNYTITAQQGICTTTLEVTIENSAGLRATASSMPSACGNSSGSISVSTTDASGEVLFSLDGGTPQTNADFSGLPPGDYSLSVEDAIGCRVELEVNVPTSVTFAAIETIITSTCAVSGCHAGNVAPDFRERQNILDRAERIGVRTGNASIPPTNSNQMLTEAEREAIACWIADGAPG